MSEVSFAKSFLATLDKRPIKLPGDHVSDPRKYPNESPYTVPKQTHPFPRRGPAAGTQPAAERPRIAVTLKPMRAGAATTLRDIGLDATVHEVKTAYATESGLALDRIRLLLNKKPAADLKTLADLGIEGDVEFGVMLMGGGGGQPTPSPAASPVVEKSEAAAAVADPMIVEPEAAAPSSEKAQAEVEQTKNETSSAAQEIKTEEFWTDLQGFLVQRLRDQGEGERLARLFRKAAG